VHVRKTTQSVFARLQRVEGLNTLMSNAMALEGLDSGARSEHLCHALFDDSLELKSRLVAAETTIAALQTEVKELKRSASPKPRKV
jgi:hypothetical protein